MARRDSRQLNLLDWIENRVAADRQRWQPMTAIAAFEQHIAAFHATAVAGDRDAQDRAIFDLNAFVRQVHDDSEHWENNSRDGSDSTWFTRKWLLQATQYLGDDDLLLGQAFAENAVLDGEPVLVICDGLASTRVTIRSTGLKSRHYWAGLGMTGFHALEGRTPLQYIVSRCTPERAA